MILFQTIMVNIYSVYDPENPLIQTKFLYTIAFAHLMRINSFFFVSFLSDVVRLGDHRVSDASRHFAASIRDDLGSLVLLWSAHPLNERVAWAVMGY